MQLYLQIVCRIAGKLCANLFTMKKHLLVYTLILSVLAINVQAQSTINFLYTSDAHYGIFRDQFRGDKHVAGWKVNEAMIGAMNKLPKMALPADQGVGAGKTINYIDYLIQTGDITNRQEPPYQSAAISWRQFSRAYQHQLQVKRKDGKSARLLMLPGNHDISNAIGFTKKMDPATDATSMVQIYNQMLHPATPLTNAKFDYRKDKVNYSKEIGGVHFMFITLWPDSAERIWMTGDLAKVPAKTPVIIFVHDQPECEAKHFSNPKAPGQFTPGNKFENLLDEVYKDSDAPLKGSDATDKEQMGWVDFLVKHPNIKAYFHGNSNWNQFYVYHGPNNQVNLPVFRVDSPMKGKYSAKDETKLSFQLISLSPQKKTLTVRECLWNTEPGNNNHPIVYGESKTIDLTVN